MEIWGLTGQICWQELEEYENVSQILKVPTIRDQQSNEFQEDVGIGVMKISTLRAHSQLILKLRADAITPVSTDCFPLQQTGETPSIGLSRLEQIQCNLPGFSLCNSQSKLLSEMRVKKI